MVCLSVGKVGFIVKLMKCECAGCGFFTTNQILYSLHEEKHRLSIAHIDEMSALYEKVLKEGKTHKDIVVVHKMVDALIGLLEHGNPEQDGLFMKAYSELGVRQKEIGFFLLMQHYRQKVKVLDQLLLLSVSDEYEKNKGTS